MAVRGTPNTTHANIESRIARAGSFSHLGRVKARRAVITLGPAQRFGLPDASVGHPEFLACPDGVVPDHT